MFTRREIEKFLFIDVETARNQAKFEDLDVDMQDFWGDKARQYYKAEDDPDFDTPYSYKEKAGLFAEFSRVVCVSTGYIRWSDDGKAVGRTRSFYGSDEKAILSEIASLLSSSKLVGYTLCGHNIKGFDIPVLARRMLINQVLPLPKILQVYDKKPWEIPFKDTMELWRFGDFKNYTKLVLLAKLFDIPSPKMDMDGSQVGDLYWSGDNYEKIARYCEADVRATMNLVLRWSGMELLTENSAS